MKQGNHTHRVPSHTVSRERLRQLLVWDSTFACPKPGVW
jgi:hypothetical protein